MSRSDGAPLNAGDRRGLLDRLLGRSPRALVAPSVRPPAPPGAAAQALRRPSPGFTPAVSAHPVVEPRARPTWASLLARVREVTKATAIVAIDDQGLVIGSHGDLEPKDVEDVAAHVALAFDLFERLSQLGTKTECVCAQYVPEGTWLTAIRLRPVDAAPLTVAILGPHTLVRDDRRRVREAFTRLLEPDPSVSVPASKE